MLWIALYLPQLPLEIFAGLASEPLALSDGQRIVVCDRDSLAQGVRPGMRPGSALALLPQLRVLMRDPEQEAEALSGIAAWAGQFTPNVALEPPTVLLLEVLASLRLFKGLPALCQALHRGLAQMGHAVNLSCAPTAKAASLLARAGKDIAVDAAGLEAALAALPVELLDGTPDTPEALAQVGVGTLGELLALPRDGVAKRFGRGLLDEIDRARGHLPDPRSWYLPPQGFAMGIALPAEVAEAGRLLFTANRLVLQLCGYLAGRSAAVQRFRLQVRHAQERSSDIAIGLVAPSRDAEHLLLLLRERLERTPLVAPASALRLEADEILPLPPGTPDLFNDATPGDWQRLTERLRARLGRTSVLVPLQRDEHRPERAGIVGEFGTETAGSTPASVCARPFWLLPKPKHLPETDAAPQYRGPLELLAGPERIESGWWDGRDARRDYFVARTAAGAMVWIYRERLTEGRWYLHGFFA